MTPDEYNQQQLESRAITASHISRLTRFWQGLNGATVDGKLGPVTRALLSQSRQTTEDGVPPDQAELSLSFDGPLEKIPATRREVYQIFGDPGPASKPNRAWRRENIVTVRDLPGIPRRWYFKVHRLCEPYMREGLRRAQQISDYRIERAACFVHRHIRHDPSKPLSLHSWGIAVDVDPGRNQARSFARGQGPVPWSREWSRIWPKGLDQGFVEAMESVGFTWGGVWGTSRGDFFHRANRTSFFDPMHFELRVR